MSEKVPLGIHAHFLLRFLLFSSLLFSFSSAFTALYQTLLLPVLNALFALCEAPFLLEQRRGVLALLHVRASAPPQILRFSGFDLLPLQQMAAIALFAATQGRTRRWRGRWIAAAVAATAATHVGVLFVGTYRAFADYWAGLSPVAQQALRGQGGGCLAAMGPLPQKLFALWNTWGGMGWPAALWLWAVRQPAAEEDRRA